MSSLRAYGQLLKHIFFKRFDTKVMPITIYGSEILGFTQYGVLEKVHFYACKRFRYVSIKSCNAAVIGDCGRFPNYIKTMRRCVKFWIRMLKMPENRLVKKCYNMMEYLDELGYNNWAMDNESIFISGFVQRLKDQFLQKWTAGVNSNRM